MREKWNILSGLLAAVLALCIVAGHLNPVALAAEIEESLSTEIETEEAGLNELDANVQEVIPSEHVLLQWNVDSSLTYRLDEENYVWTIYDSDGNVLTNGSGMPASAGYQLTGYGDWFGSAVVKLTITNHLTDVAHLRLMFVNDLSAAALEISSTLESEDDNVTYDPTTGELTVEPGAEGVVTLTITADVLQQINAVIDEENTIAGWIQVQMLSPVDTDDEELAQNSDELSEEAAEDTDEEMIEDPVGETADETTEGTTEPSANEATGELIEEPTATSAEESGEAASEEQKVE